MADDSQATQPNVHSSGLPKINFLTFMVSLAHAAMIHLGEAEGFGEPSSINLPLAKQNIDILEMLKEKTKGNLDEEEKRFLESSLHDIRLTYVRKCKESCDNC